MKRSLQAVCLAMALMAVTACQFHTPVQNRQAWRDGIRTAEKLAKQDAIHARCFHYPATTKGMRFHQKHRLRLEKEKGPDFMQGFNSRYKRAFREYMELYCGNGDKANLPLRD
ncbi:MAG: hypothetical protein R6V54_03865 [Desulfobacteraceae bacterium]